MPKLKLPSFLNRYNTKGNKRKLLGLIVVIIVGLVGFAGWSLWKEGTKDNKKVFAQAAGHKIYEQEVRDFLGDNVYNISDHDAATVLANKYLTEKLAKENNITVTDQEVEEQFGSEINKQKTDFKYAYQNKVNQLYFEKLAAYKRGIYKGKVLVAHFSRNIAPDVVLRDDKEANPDLGNSAAIARDKKYAKDFINRIYKDIKSGKITFDEAIKIERKDPVVGLKGYPTLNHSGVFDTSAEGGYGLIWTKFAKQRIRDMAPGQLSEPFVVRVPNSIEGDDTVESYFLVVQMDEMSGEDGSVKFEQYLNEAKNRLEYGVYV